ncbi:hypothetical protein GGF46_004439 [Coemansia sp. RSA 552]|nr:hypothetical protein GGF46_004439 [Coemansia sp. RSA 552]
MTNLNPPQSQPPPVPGQQSSAAPAYTPAPPGESGASYPLTDNAALDRQHAAISASRTLLRSPSRSQLTDADALAQQTEPAMPALMGGMSGMALGGAPGSAMASDDEALMTAATQAARSGARSSAHKRISRGTAAAAEAGSRPHTNSSHPPPPLPLPQEPAAQQLQQPKQLQVQLARHKADGPMMWAENNRGGPEPRAPTPAMYWTRRNTWGERPPKMRSQTMTVIGSSLYVFGGWNNNACYNDIYVLDSETMFWTRMQATGDAVPPCRAHTATVVNYRLFVFGGGDGSQYFSDLYVLDTRACSWTRAKITGAVPSPRRTHTCFHYDGYVYLFGGGDGHRALNDLWRVRAEPDSSGAYTWEEVPTTGGRPFPRGYHTSTLVGNQVVVFGGSDGQECFGDTSLLNLDTLEWSHVAIDPPLTRLAHTATLVGMYLFVICGHDGSDYSNQILMLKLDTLKWETRVIYGKAPIPRGYHATALHDGRLFLHGGYNGQDVFDDLYTLELSSYSYLPQVPEFVIGCHR